MCHKLNTLFHSGDNARPTLIICLRFARLLTFPSVVLNIAGLISHVQTNLAEFFHLES